MRRCGLRFLRPGAIRLSLLLVALGALTAAARLDVQAQSAPTLYALEARAWRSLLYTDDVLVVVEFNLPQQTTVAPTPVSGTPEAWCAWLGDQTGCGTNPVQPDFPTSLLASAAFVTLCDLTGTSTNCLNAGGGLLLSQTRIPRIYYGLAGVYLGPGSGAWGDTSLHMCVESGTLFVTGQSNCTTISWNSEANTQAAQRDEFGQDMRAMLLNIQDLRNLPRNSLVAGNLITSAGRVLATEAFTYAPNIAPTYFQAAAELVVQTPYAVNLTPRALVKALQATATASAWGSFDGAASELFGSSVSGGTLSAILFLAAGFIVALFTFPFFRDIAIALVIIASIGSLNIFVDPLAWEAWVLAVSLWGIFTAWLVVRRAPDA
jgi:hypothetical protein